MTPPPTLSVVPLDPVAVALAAECRRQLHVRGCITLMAPPSEEEKGCFRSFAGWIIEVLGHEHAARLAGMGLEQVSREQ
jgi:hypothetical protein